MSSLANARTRLVADPSIGVSDLMSPLQKLIEARDDRNVFKLVQAPPNVSWKSGTPVQWLCNLAPLWISYVKIAPNTIISGKRHKQALVRLDETEKINYTKKPINDLVDILDDTIRMGLSHLRQLKQFPDAKERAFRKADSQQQELLEEVLDLITIKPEVETQLAICDNTVSPPPAPRSPPLVNSGPSSGSRPALTLNLKLNYESIFDEVLTSESGATECVITLCDTKQEGAHVQSASPASTPSPHKKKTPKRKSSAFELAISDSDRQLLQQAQVASPIAKDGKSQQQRLNQTKPKKTKGSKGAGNKGSGDTKKGKGKGKDNGKKGKEGKEGKGNQHPSQKVQKKPSQKTLDEDVDVDCETFPVVMPEFEPDPSTSELSRSKARNRYVSQAYHGTCDALKKAGAKDWEQIKAAGRRAHKTAALRFDNQIWAKDATNATTQASHAHAQHPEEEEEGGTNTQEAKGAGSKTKKKKTKNAKKKKKKKTPQPKAKETEEPMEPPVKRLKPKAKSAMKKGGGDTTADVPDVM